MWASIDPLMDRPIKELLCVHCNLQKVHLFNSIHYKLLLLFQIAVITDTDSKK